MEVNWGIIGTGAIAEKFISDFRLTQGGTIKAVASRTYDKANEFATDRKSTRLNSSHAD